MNQVMQTEEKKSPLMKTGAVVLFILVVVICAWAAVKLAMMIPTGFSRLADLADTVYQHDPMAEAELNSTVSQEDIESGTIVSIDWNDTGVGGYYSFSYPCIDGVAVDIRANDDIYQVECDDPFVLPANTYTLDAYISSEKMRVAYVPLTIDFITEDEELKLDSTHTLIVTNSDIPTRIVEEPESEEEIEEEPKETPEETTPTTPTRTVSTWKYVEPESDPNGYTDLQVIYLGVGVVSRDGVFTPRTYLDEDEEGAFQFMVKNIGTKTSTVWYFEGRLPSDTEFESGNQAVLRPTEKATFTIGFENASDDGGRFSITAYGGNDINTANNSFSQSVLIR